MSGGWSGLSMIFAITSGIENGWNVFVATSGSWFGVTCRWMDCGGGGGRGMLLFGFIVSDLPRRLVWCCESNGLTDFVFCFGVSFSELSSLLFDSSLLLLICLNVLGATVMGC